MLRVLDDADLRTALIGAGHLRVRSLTPAEAARRLVMAYRLAAKRD
jgi:hypothetical protein